MGTGKWLPLMMAVFLVVPAMADDVPVVTVADPYIELHTGPGRGYPITHIIERGTEVSILKRRTDWFKVRAENGISGWTPRAQLQATLQPSGEPLDIPEARLAAYLERRWEVGALAGDFGGATAYTGYASYRLSRHLAAELSASQILGNFSDGWGASINIVHIFMPQWRASPFFSLGTGIIHIEPKASLAQSPDRTDQTAIVGVGVSAYLSRSFAVRAEYRSYLVLSSRNDNEDVDEWKAGFAVFF